MGGKSTNGGSGMVASVEAWVEAWVAAAVHMACAVRVLEADLGIMEGSGTRLCVLIDPTTLY